MIGKNFDPNKIQYKIDGTDEWIDADPKGCPDGHYDRIYNYSGVLVRPRPFMGSVK